MHSIRRRLVLPAFSVADPDEPHYLSLLRRQRYAEALPLLQKAVVAGDADAMCQYATLLATGEGGLEMNLEEAARWFRRAAILGDMYANTALGLMLATGTGVRQDVREASYWLYQGAIRRHMLAIEALNELSILYPEHMGYHFTDAQLKKLVRIYRLWTALLDLHEGRIEALSPEQQEALTTEDFDDCFMAPRTAGGKFSLEVN